MLSELKSVHSGLKKAKRDYKKVNAFHAEHAARHENDPNYQCHDFIRDFWANLGKDVHPRIDIYEAAGYSYGRERLIARHGDPVGEGVDVVTVEMDGGETYADLLEKVKRAFEDKQAFDDVVSETTKSKKGGK